MKPKRELKRLKILFDSLDFKPVRGILLEGYHRNGPGRPFYDPESLVRALMLQRLDRIPSERALADRLRESRGHRRACGFRGRAPSRWCFGSLRRRLGPRIQAVFRSLVRQAQALKALRGRTLAIDSTAFGAFSARDASGRRGRSDPEADVGRAGRGYILGYRAHVLCCAHRDLPVAFTVQPCSRNDKLFYRPLLQQARDLSAGVRWVAADRQYDSEELRRWTREALEASTAIPTYRRRGRGRGPRTGRALRVDGRFRVTGPKRAVRAYRRRLAVERVFKKMKRQLGLEAHHLRGLANATAHVCLVLMCVLAVAIASYRTGRRARARSVRYWTA